MEKLEKEYNELVKIYGLKRVSLLFTSGLDGFKKSRLQGHYSLDAIKQSLNKI